MIKFHKKQDAIDLSEGMIKQIQIINDKLTDEEAAKIAMYTTDRMLSVIPKYADKQPNAKWHLMDTVFRVLQEKLQAKPVES